MATLTMNLNDAIGQTVRIEGYRGDDGGTGCVREVVEVRDIFKKLITSRTHHSNIITRDRYLLTVKLSDGGHKSFYVGRIGKLDVLSATQKILLKIRNIIG